MSGKNKLVRKRIKVKEVVKEEEVVIVKPKKNVQIKTK